MDGPLLRPWFSPMNPKTLVRLQVPRLLVVLLLVSLLGLGAIPAYLKGQPPGMQPPRVEGLAKLRQLRQTPIALSGWQQIERGTLELGQHKWVRQTLQDRNQNPAILLLLPQGSSKDQPEVEWTDIDGSERWSTDSHRSLQFTTTSGAKQARVAARFFRSWTNRQTYAVLQWYAWAGGGNSSPLQWFVADRVAQWQHRRVPWVAVSILMAIDPMGEIETARPGIETLAQQVQTALMTQFLP